MRTFKFRGKRIDNGEWIYGSLVIEAYPDFCNYFIRTKDEEDWTSRYKDVLVDKNTLGQFTGLYDKNNKEIYEGDIIIGDIPELISSQNLIGIVEYEGSAFIIEFPNRASWQIQKVGFCSFINYKVIGNMYDNPELLEEQTDE